MFIVARCAYRGVSTANLVLFLFVLFSFVYANYGEYMRFRGNNNNDSAAVGGMISKREHVPRGDKTPAVTSRRVARLRKGLEVVVARERRESGRE